MINSPQLAGRKLQSGAPEFRLAFDPHSPVTELVLTQSGLFGNILIRGEDYCGCTKAVVGLCADAASAGIGIIYVTDRLVPSLAEELKARARDAFGEGKYHALRVNADTSDPFKVSRRGVAVLHFNSQVAPSSVDKVRQRMPIIMDWITSSNIEQPLLLALDSYHLYGREFVVELLERAGAANCAILLTTLGTNPRGPALDLHPKVIEKCATILDLNRRRSLPG